MSENTESNAQEENQQPAQEHQGQASDGVKLNGLFAFKMGMSSVYDENGNAVPVTVLQYRPWVVSQVKTQESDGYSAVQIACGPKKAKRSGAAEAGHLKTAGFVNGARFIKEVRQDLPEGVSVGQKVALDSLVKGDTVKITANSKGRGFAGAMKRHGFGGGPATHGAKFHRAPGAIGNCTFPGRVMKGKSMPGHFGDRPYSLPRVKVVDIMPEKNVVLVKGSVPGSRNSLVKLMKV